MHTYFNRYPILTGSGAATEVDGSAVDQQSFKDCILDFNQGMLDAGMIRTTTPDQLDLDNIPDVNYLSHVSNIFGYIHQVYKPLIYTFNDELNNQHPLFVKITFMLISLCQRNNNARSNTLFLYSKVSISKTDDFLVNVEFNGHYQYSGNASYYNNTHYMYSSHIYGDSEIYIGDVSTFHICPNMGSIWTYDRTHIMRYHLLAFIIDRQQNGDVILICNSGSNSVYYDTSISNNSYKPTATAYLYSNNTTWYDSTTNSIFQSMPQSTQLSNPSQLYMSASQYAGLNHNHLNYNILNADTNYFPLMSHNFVIKVKLPDGKFHRYRLIRHPQYPYNFAQPNYTSTTPTRKCILIRLREDENDV